MTTTTTTTTRDSFDRFGDDLTQLLISYLRIEEKLLYQFVCKQWQRLIFNTQTNLIIDKKYYFKQLDKIVTKCPYIRTVVFTDILTDELLHRFMDLLIKCCPQIRYLHINHFDIKSNNYYLFDSLFAKIVGQLIGFKTNSSQLMKSFVKCLDQLDETSKSKVQTLAYNGNDFYLLFNYNNYNECVLPKTVKSLAIMVTIRYDIDLPLLKIFVNNYKQNIRSFDLIMVYDINETIVELFASILPQMTELSHLSISIYHNNNIWDEDPDSDNIIYQYFDDLFAKVSHNCLKLKSLDIFSRFYVRHKSTIDKLMDTINTRLRQLKRLTIKLLGIDKDIKPTISSLQLMKQLTHLSIYYMYEIGSIAIGDEFFVDIDRHLPRLQYLNAYKVDITSDSLNYIYKLLHLKIKSRIFFIDGKFDRYINIESLGQEIDGKLRYLDVSQLVLPYCNCN